MSLLELFKTFTRGQENAQDQLNANFVALEGAVIVDSGSNSNGNWVKFADGTMICYGRRQTNDEIVYPHGALFRSGSNRWVYPMPFKDLPALAVTPVSGVSYIWASVGQSTATDTGCDFGVFSPDVRNVKPLVSIIAIGHWK